MKTFHSVRFLSPGLLLAAMSCPVAARAQDAAPTPARRPNASPMDAIHARYRIELEKLERRRLDQIGELAAGQLKAEAEATYQDYFQLAISKGLYKEAEPSADRLLKAGGNSTDLQTLATLVKIVAQADRGAYEDSLESLERAVGLKAGQAKPPGGPGRDPGLTASSRATIVESYYQRLIRSNQYEVARKAMKLVADNAETPAVRDLAARRAKQLELVGVQAPPIAGTDLDGKPFRLEDARGEVVLVVFWATWCVPSAQDIPWLEEIYKAHHDRGFRVVGIDVDEARDGNADPKSVVPEVRRYLVEFNVPWPTLINGRGDQDWTRAYSVAEIPASVLIGRDGKVVHLDLSGPYLDRAVAEAVDRKP